MLFGGPTCSPPSLLRRRSRVLVGRVSLTVSRLPPRLGGQAGLQEAAAEDVEAAAAEGAGGETAAGRGGTAQTGGRNPADP